MHLISKLIGDIEYEKNQVVLVEMVCSVAPMNLTRSTSQVPADNLGSGKGTHYTDSAPTVLN